MHASRKQRTVASTAAVDGFGYFSGQDVRVEFRPAGPDTGIVFVRADLDPPVEVPAVVANRVEMPRRTTLSWCGVRVELVEHVMAALSGLQIDNCQVWVDAPELPGMDGSAAAFVDAIDRAGIVRQSPPVRHWTVRSAIRWSEGDAWIEASPAGEHALTVEYHLDYGSVGGIGRQSLRLRITPETFRRELASCRTFMLKEEADWMRHQGLGRRVRYRDLLVFDANGPIGNPLRFEDECVRHKMLDLIGDLALLGRPLSGRAVAHRSGHRLNAAFVRALLNVRGTEALRRIA